MLKFFPNFKLQHSLPDAIICIYRSIFYTTFILPGSNNFYNIYSTQFNFYLITRLVYTYKPFEKLPILIKANPVAKSGARWYYNYEIQMEGRYRE